MNTCTPGTGCDFSFLRLLQSPESWLFIPGLQFSCFSVWSKPNCGIYKLLMTFTCRKYCFSKIFWIEKVIIFSDAKTLPASVFQSIFDLAAPCVYYYTITTHVSLNSHEFIQILPPSPKKTHICTISLCRSSTALCSCRKKSPLPSPLMFRHDQ